MDNIYGNVESQENIYINEEPSLENISDQRKPERWTAAQSAHHDEVVVISHHSSAPKPAGGRGKPGSFMC